MNNCMISRLVSGALLLATAYLLFDFGYNTGAGFIVFFTVLALLSILNEGKSG